MVVVLVEVARKGYLAAVVPVIVNAILSEHQLVVDIVAFVSKGDFPRSRLGEKQRGKILATWVTRKMRTIAQFGIRDPDGADSQITEVAEPNSRMGSQYNGSIVASSLRHAEAAEDPSAQDYVGEQTAPPDISEQQQQQQQQQLYAPVPDGISEMPAAFDDCPDESTMYHNRGLASYHDDDTPTDDAGRRYHFELPGIAPYDGSTPPPINLPPKRSDIEPNHYETGLYPYPSDIELSTNTPPPPTVPPKTIEDDLTPLQGTLNAPPRTSNKRQSSYLPSVSGHETLDMAEQNDFDDQPSGSLAQPTRLSSDNIGGGLRIANADPSSDEEDDDDRSTRADPNEWPQEAIMHMNLSSSDNRPTSKKTSRGAKLGMHVYGQSLTEAPVFSGQQQQPQHQQQQQLPAPGPPVPPKERDDRNPNLYDGYGYGHAM